MEGTQFLINGKPFYFHGVDKHEDADVRLEKLQCENMILSHALATDSWERL